MFKFSDLAALTVSDELITIRRYQESDFAGLKAVFDPAILCWYFAKYDTCEEFVQEKMADFAKENLVMLVIIDNKTGKIIGTSTLYEISFTHKRLEIGSSWLASDYQGTEYNAVAKLRIIDHLITKLGFIRIQLKTDALNEQSKHAMEKLGFVYEGTLRNHAITYSGRIRNSLIFSIIKEDWPTVKQTILARIVYKQKQQYR